MRRVRQNKGLRVCFAFVFLCAAFLAPIIAGEMPAVSDWAALTNLVNGVWATNTTLAKVFPPAADMTFVNDQGTMSVDSSFSLTGLVGSASLGITMYPVQVIESNAAPRVRMYFNATGGVFRTEATPANYDSSNWTVSVYGNPGAWLTGTNLSGWYAGRDPGRQRVALSLISTSDVPAYLSALSNAAGSANSGGTNTPVLILFSNETLFVKTEAADNFRTMYLHAPDSVTGFSVYASSAIAAPWPGAWNLVARLPHNNDPLTYTYFSTAEFVSFALGTTLDRDGDGISDADETMLFGTDPQLADTDGDGNSDFVEVMQYGTSATQSDADGDGVPDSAETDAGCTSPNIADTFTDFQLARILKLDAIKVTVISGFSTVYLTTTATGTEAELLDTGISPLSPSGQRTLAPCEIGASADYGNGRLQYTALESIAGSSDSMRTLRVYMDHYDATFGVTISNVPVRIDMDGGEVVSLATWHVSHDCSIQTPASNTPSSTGDAITWSANFGYRTNPTTYSDGGYGWQDITYKPKLPHLTVSPNPAFVAVNSTAITFTASSTNLPYTGTIWWKVNPKVAGGPTIVGGTAPITRTNDTIQLQPGCLQGVYVLTARPSGMATLGGAATVTVVSLSITNVPNNDVLCASCDTIFYANILPITTSSVNWSITLDETSCAYLTNTSANQCTLRLSSTSAQGRVQIEATDPTSGISTNILVTMFSPISYPPKITNGPPILGPLLEDHSEAEYAWCMAHPGLVLKIKALAPHLSGTVQSLTTNLFGAACSQDSRVGNAFQHIYLACFLSQILGSPLAAKGLLDAHEQYRENSCEYGAPLMDLHNNALGLDLATLGCSDCALCAFNAIRNGAAKWVGNLPAPSCSPEFKGSIDDAAVEPCMPAP